MEKLKAVVIGVGHLGRHHARIYHEMEDVELIGVVDTDKKKADEIAEAYGIYSYNNEGDIPGEIQIASVVVPTTDHYDIATRLLKRGIHCLVEKPMTETVYQAEQLLEQVKNNETILQVGHIERFNPAIMGLQEILKVPRFIECHRLCQYNPRGTDVSVVLDLMIHDLDIILYVVNAPIVEIRASGIHVINATEDIANCRLEFANGCVANITASRVSPENLRKIRIFQDDAYLSLDYIAQEGLLYRKQNLAITIDKKTFTKDEPLRLEIRSFVDCIREKKEPLVSGQQGYQAVKVAHQVVDIIKEHNRKFNIG